MTLPSHSGAMLPGIVHSSQKEIAMPPLMRFAIVALLHLSLWALGAATLPEAVLGILGAV